VSADYLLAFPRRGNMDYAIPDATNNRTPEGPIRRLDWSASSGVRALAGWRPGGGLGRFPVRVHPTSTATTGRPSTAPTGGLLYATQTRPGLVDTAANVDASSRLAYNVYDLTVGRTVPLENFFSLRFSAGARIAAIYQTIDTTYNGLQATTPACSTATRSSAAG